LGGGILGLGFPLGTVLSAGIPRRGLGGPERYLHPGWRTVTAPLPAVSLTEIEGAEVAESVDSGVDDDDDDDDNDDD
jgi:hypothetical protein